LLIDAFTLIKSTLDFAVPVSLFLKPQRVLRKTFNGREKRAVVFSTAFLVPGRIK
jgi:hypothetical protein